MIIAIDPGNEQSAYVLISEDNLQPCEFDIINNDSLLKTIERTSCAINHLAIEMVASYGMAVGKTVFDTCVWIGRFWQASQTAHKQRIYRKQDVCMNLCHNTRAKDSNVSQALRDRFGEKGTMANPGWFYGFKKDIWQAYAVGVTYHDLYVSGGDNDGIL